MTNINDFLTVAEVAEQTGYSQVTIRAKIRDGILPAIRRGRKLLVARNDIQKLFTPVNR